MLTCEDLRTQEFNLQAGDIVVAKSGAKNAVIGLGSNLAPLKLVLANNPVLSTPFVPSGFDGGDRVIFDTRATHIEAGIKSLLRF